MGDVKSIWEETEKKYNPDKQIYQSRIQDNIQKSETDIKSHINEKIVQIQKDIATNMDQSNANLEKEITQVRNDIATNIDDVKSIWEETEKKYNADKQIYQSRIQDNIQKSETDIKSHINEKIVQIQKDIATNMDQSNAK